MICYRNSFTFLLTEYGTTWVQHVRSQFYEKCLQKCMLLHSRVSGNFPMFPLALRSSVIHIAFFRSFNSQFVVYITTYCQMQNLYDVYWVEQITATLWT
jgi:hypothetical protein